MAKLSIKQKEELCLMALEVDNNGKKKYTQQYLADKFKISKGMVNRYIKEKVNKSKQIIDSEVRVLGELEKIEIEKSELFSKQEQMEVNKQVRDRLEMLKKTENVAIGFQDIIQAKQSATLKLIEKVDEFLEAELQKAETEDDIQKLYDAYNTKLEMIMSFDDIKKGAEANDKLGQTLGVVERFSTKQEVNVNNTKVEADQVQIYIPSNNREI